MFTPNVSTRKEYIDLNCSIHTKCQCQHHHYHASVKIQMGSGPILNVNADARCQYSSVTRPVSP